jgi:hypothetical protein
MQMQSSTTLPLTLESSTSTPPVARKRGKQATEVDLLKLKFFPQKAEFPL